MRSSRDGLRWREPPSQDASETSHLSGSGDGRQAGRALLAAVARSPGLPWGSERSVDQRCGWASPAAPLPSPPARAHAGQRAANGDSHADEEVCGCLRHCGARRLRAASRCAADECGLAPRLTVKVRSRVAPGDARPHGHTSERRVRVASPGARPLPCAALE
eukprot:825027-Prymnesium_polylepis.1